MAMVQPPEPVPNLTRVRILTAVIVAGLLGLVARLWYLQIAHGAEYRRLSEGNHTRLIRRLAPRGLITDHTGHILASSRPKIVVSIVPAEAKKDPGVLQLLARLLGRPPTELEAVLPHDKVPHYDPVRVALDVDVATATRIEERRLDLPGVSVGPEPIRYYPQGPVYGHILGQIGQIPPDELMQRRDEGYRPGDFCGRLGIERAYDSMLHGKDGGMLVEVDARGRSGAEISSFDPVPGARVELTVDARVQQAAYDELAVWAARGHPGAAVALDPRTGAVLALVSVPSFDPNQFATGINASNWNALRNDPLKPLINRASGSAYAPGSTFKLITATAGLCSGRITPQDRVYCSGVIYLGRWPKRCHKASGHGSVDMVRAIQVSCDIYFYRLGQRLGPELMAQWARTFGLGKRTGIDLVRPGDPPVERAGVVPSPEWKRKRGYGPWVGGDTVDFAIGQAMLACTPLQMCNVAAAIANGGTLYRPQLVSRIVGTTKEGGPKVIQTLQPQVLGHIPFTPEALQVVREGMLQVMRPGGTASHATLPGVTIAGKTGTAQQRIRGKMVNHAWFVGYAPAENPSMAVCVFVEGGGHGGTVAAPIARKMFGAYFNIHAPAAATVHTTD
jgi:penicillin-binding protein 2